MTVSGLGWGGAGYLLCALAGAGAGLRYLLYWVLTATTGLRMELAGLLVGSGALQ